jgi:UDPglucose 6-dehydrogenase
MKIGFVGTGKLGMPCALAVNYKGHEVFAYDVNPECMQKEKFPHKERDPFNNRPTIVPLLRESTIQFVPLASVIHESEIIFVSVQTPHDPLYEGITRLPDERVDFDYTYLIDSMREISNIVADLDEQKIVVIISTVLPGTLRREVLPIIPENLLLAYNPFFIAMGTTIQDFLNPEFVLLGVHDLYAKQRVFDLYLSLIPGLVSWDQVTPETRGDSTPCVETTIDNAELVKCTYNTYITGKIDFINTVMEICHKTPNTDVDSITKALVLGNRRLISPAYLRGGAGDSGGCHPRDNISMSWLARKLGLSYDWFENLMLCRENQTEWLAHLIMEQCRVHNLPVYLLGRSFKPETNLVVGSSILLLESILTEFEVDVTSFDPNTSYVDLEGVDLKAISQDYVRATGPAIYFIGTKHECFRNVKFPSGSVVIDLWRFINQDQSPDVELIRVGDSISNARRLTHGTL